MLKKSTLLNHIYKILTNHIHKTDPIISRSRLHVIWNIQETFLIDTSSKVVMNKFASFFFSLSPCSAVLKPDFYLSRSQA